MLKKVRNQKLNILINKNVYCIIYLLSHHMKPNKSFYFYE